MTSINTRGAAALAAMCLMLVACPDDLPGLTESDTSDDDDNSSTADPSTTLPPTTLSGSGTATTSTTTPDTESDSDTTGDPPDTETGETATTTTGEPPDTDGTSTGVEDIDIDCEGPVGDDTCDTPSPYAGDGDCDPYAQDCDAGEKCMPWANDGGNSWNATRCSPVAPDPNQLGDVCTVEGSGVSGVDDCDIGLMCFGVDAMTNMGLCVELCGCGPDEPTCAGGGTICSISNAGGSLPICLPTCDPLDGTTCDAGQGCYPSGNNFLCAFDASGGGGAAGEECMFLNGCDPGLFCGGAAGIPGCPGAACCTEYCDTEEGNGPCSLAGTECVALFPAGTEPEECHIDTGSCIAP